MPARAEGTIWRTRIWPNARTVFGRIGGTVPGLPADRDVKRWAAVTESAQQIVESTHPPVWTGQSECLRMRQVKSATDGETQGHAEPVVPLCFFCILDTRRERQAR